MYKNETLKKKGLNSINKPTLQDKSSRSKTLPGKVKKYVHILNQFKSKKILVIGDLMLDHYLWGQINRISPEAPVPIVDVEKKEYRLGGAANVVNNISSLEATPLVVGIVGSDNEANILLDLFKQKNILDCFIIRDNSRPTTIKSRLFAANQQVMRYDEEKVHDLSSDVEQKIIQNIDNSIHKADAIILEDYNKGLLTPRIIKHSIEKANQLKIPITVDPKFQNFFEYKNCTVFKPNFQELQKNLGIEIKNKLQLESSVKRLFDKIKPEYLVITISEKGLLIFDKKQKTIQIPTFAREVFDVSGAGDTVISVLTLCLACNVDIETSTILANHAAGAVCGKRGIHPATVDDILTSLQHNKIFT